MSAKFCPMPQGPLDLYDLFLSFEKFASNMRWGWFHYAKKKKDMEDDIECEDDDFVMTPWYKRTDKKAPKGNHQLEAALERLSDILFDPSNRRRVTDNLTPQMRLGMRELRNLPNTNNAQVTFEDKGSRFVIRNLDYQDNLICEQLNDGNNFDQILSDPTERVKVKINRFCDKWSTELTSFHPNIVNFLTDLSDSKSSTVKGLVKCHKKPRPDGKHDI